MKRLTVLICGDRNWSNVPKIQAEINKLPRGTTVLEGGCSGADTLANALASRRGLVVRTFPADWCTYGRAAGPIRNTQMLREHPDLVLAFHSNLSQSRGTADTVRKARKLGIKTRVVT